jgi:hypothetical protein
MKLPRRGGSSTHSLEENEKEKEHEKDSTESSSKGVKSTRTLRKSKLIDTKNEPNQSSESLENPEPEQEGSDRTSRPSTNPSDANLSQGDDHGASEESLDSHNKLPVVEEGNEWTVKHDLLLLMSIIQFRPVGVHKHFRMLAIFHHVCRGLQNAGFETSHLTTERLWQRLNELYDIPTLEMVLCHFCVVRFNEMMQNQSNLDCIACS